MAVMIFAQIACAEQLKWQSATTGGEIAMEVLLPRQKRLIDRYALIVYQKNLSVARVGTQSDNQVLQQLSQEGTVILVLDYQHHPKAKSPFLSADSLKLRQDLTAKQRTLLADLPIDPDHIFILVEGNLLLRDVEFARDGDRVLGMDILYPSNPAKRVPLLMEITCDNQNRMGSSSLIFCRDTLLDVAQAEGFAVAMVDHPVRAPYKGLDDPMPESLDRMKAAVAKLNEIKDQYHGNGKVGAIGFSRGGPFAAMLAMQGDVNAALVHGNRYDYNALIDKDPMLARFEKAWGKRDDNPWSWAKHSALTYFTNKCSPMFLNTSDKESAEYQAGLELLHNVLAQYKIEHEYTVDQDGRGHRVTMDPGRMSQIYAFFRKHLEN